MQTPCLLASIREIDPEMQDRIDAITSTVRLSELVLAALALSRALTVLVVEAVLEVRAAAPTQWPPCPECGLSLHSKGRVWREMNTIVGKLRWRRRVGRCPANCRIGQVAPLDDALGLAPGQRTSNELKRYACLLSVFVPFETVSAILERITGLKVSGSSIWEWVQEAGQSAIVQLEAEIKAMHAGVMPIEEVIGAEVRKMMVILGADGVMVAFRSATGTGATVWREVKVAVISRIERAVNRCGKPVTHLHQRRLVAVLGDIDALADRVRLEAKRQQIHTAPKIAWLSDGARGLWRIFDEHFADQATGILDFYHAAGQLWEAAMARYDCRASAEIWFPTVRHKLRHGKVGEVIATLAKVAKEAHRHPDRNDIIERVTNYLSRHEDHLRFPEFQDQGMPLGSGFVESAVKWLIQQRFKGVGMRWSEDGFNHLLMLRLAWANDRFDQLFEAGASGTWGRQEALS
jgi:hypothetical protein